ncbi:ninein-like protein isoform X1 [Denticeps clupeoides]|uniref:ninein-like protein isoform X1 n=1 Tax=Denticeps clupeoides TaxID=299321 RepID=UPI0010A58C81|nr:ninein-like protein isoform X1 [Denticeps clupeoides]XP_028844525.1 ninein-like protein isoform X1 [Denticeps clupeoides]
MDEEEQNRYVTQLKDEFDSCDTTGTGYLDKEELTALCHKLHLDAHLPLLLNTLLGPQHYARVNFEEFKEGFVAVLSQSLDFSTSEEESSYLEPVVPEEVKPKYVKGTKRYGRKSKPESPSSELTADSEGRSPFTADPSENTGVRRPKLRRATSLESVESLKSDEETEGSKDTVVPSFEAQGQQRQWNQDSAGSPQCSLVLKQGVTDIQVRAVWEELGVGAGGSLSRQELSVVCEHIGLKDLQTEELDALFRKLDKDQDGRVSLREFQTGLFRYADLPPPKSSSTPLRPSSAQHALLQAFEERPVRSISPSLLSATVGQKLLTRLDDGSGCTSPDRVITLWTEEGIRNSRDILQTLDFSLDERLGLAELTLALDNELLASGNGIHQAALISYKNEIQFLHGLAEQACRERDKVKADLEWANRRNLQLVREVEDRHATLESLNETKIRGLEQDFRDKLTALRSESEQDSEVLLERVEQEQTKLKEEVEILRAQDVSLQEEICTAVQENSRLEEEVSALKGKLTESQCTISRLQKDLDHLLQDKFSGLDPSHSGPSQEERFSEIIKEYEQQCRELRDRNDELSAELEALKSHGSARKSRRLRESMSSLKWSGRRALTTESDSDDPEMKKATSPHVKKKLQIENKNVLSSLDSLSAPVSIETELAMEQMKVKYEQEVHDLKIQLETKVNFYERTMELMRNNMEVERKDISYGFKIEISELEEQKAQAEEHVVRLKQAMEKLEAQQHTRVESGAWGSEHERRFQRERAELEQNYVREMGNIVQRLTSEKDQLEAEMKLKMDQEVLLVREEAEHRQSQMRLQYDDVQRTLLHQLQERLEQHCKEQGQWEARMLELERETRQEKLHHEEICSKMNHKRKRQEEVYKEEVWRLQEHIANLQTQLELTKRAEVESYELQKKLEEKLEEMCLQLEDNTVTLKSQDLLIRDITTDVQVKDNELEVKRVRETELHANICQLKQELEVTRAETLALLEEKDVIQSNCDRLSNKLIQQQAQLGEKEEELHELRTVKLLSSKEAAQSDLKSVLVERAEVMEKMRRLTSDFDGLQQKFKSLTEHTLQTERSERVLTDALRLEKIKVREIQTLLDQEQEERELLLQEKSTYSHLSNQLSAQVVEMEEEAEKLREDLQKLRLELRAKEGLVQELRSQLEARGAEMDELWAEVQKRMHAFEPTGRPLGELQRLTTLLEDKETELWSVQEKADNATNQLQQSLIESREEVRGLEESFEQEKNRMKEQVLEMEKLVLALETVIDPGGPCRTQLNDMNSENRALKDRLAVLQQDFKALEEETDKKKKKLGELEREQEKKREEEERLHKENAKYREEVLDLSGRNLQLSTENAELSSRLRSDESAVQMLTERLALVCQQQEDGASTIRQLQESSSQRDREMAELQASWLLEQGCMERELKKAREKTHNLSEIQSALANLTLKHQQLEKDHKNLLQVAEERHAKIEKLQETICDLDNQTDQLHSQLQAMTQDKASCFQEMATHQRLLHESQDKVQELEANVAYLSREKERLQMAEKKHAEDAAEALAQESSQLRSQNQELLQKVQALEIELHKLTQECLVIKSSQVQLETTTKEAKEQALRANTALSLVQAQHTREVQQMREQVGVGSREQLVQIQGQLTEQQRRSQQMEETLRSQAQKASAQLALKQEQYEKVMVHMQERVEELEAKLKNVRAMLQEKVNQLKEQLAKNAKSDLLLKDLYVENSQLMKALQITEQRQKSAEKKSFLLEEKVATLNKLLRKIAPASLSA